MPKGKLRTHEEKVRELQDQRHRSAKRDKARRFHQLCDKVAGPWFLWVAWQRVRANKGAPGPDGVAIERPAAQIVEEMNSVLRGWGKYFHFANPQHVMARPKAVCGHAQHRRSPNRTHALTRGRRKRRHAAH